jgi:hypothetical protein
MKTPPDYVDPRHLHVTFADLRLRYGLPFTRKYLRKLMDANLFPQPIMVGERTWAWPLQEILDYLASKPVRVPEPAKASARKAGKRADRRMFRKKPTPSWSRPHDAASHSPLGDGLESAIETALFRLVNEVNQDYDNEGWMDRLRTLADLFLKVRESFEPSHRRWRMEGWCDGHNWFRQLDDDGRRLLLQVAYYGLDNSDDVWKGEILDHFCGIHVKTIWETAMQPAE